MRGKSLSDEFIGLQLTPSAFYSNPLVLDHNIRQARFAFTMANVIGFALFVWHILITVFYSSIEQSLTVITYNLIIILSLLPSIILINLPKYYFVFPKVLWLTSIVSFTIFVVHFTKAANTDWLLFASSYYLLAIIIVAPVLKFWVYLGSCLFFGLLINVGLILDGINLQKLLYFNAQMIALGACALLITYRQQLNSYRNLHMLLNMKEMWSIDWLTGVLNRGSWHKRLQSQYTQALEEREELVMLLLDIDDFKQVNDSFGHQTGDQVIQRVAQICRHNVRSGDFVGRLGGEEFGLLLPEISVKDGEKIAQRILQQLREHQFVMHDRSFNVTASIGLSSLYIAGSGQQYLQASSILACEQLFRLADDALYLAKDKGRDRCQLAGY